jgi:hypothetical protein
MNARKILITRMLQMFIFTCVISCVAKAATFSWSDFQTNCVCKTATVGTLTSEDLDQSQAAQDAAWEDFKGEYPGLVDSDRLGNRTYRFNCHALVYAVYGRFLNGDQIAQFHGYSSKCWEVDASGSIKSSYYHSCFVNNYGKCGAEFYCKNNQCVYGASMPTVKYKRN